MTVTHATFVIERVYRASPERVFAAFSDQQIKDRWFGSPPGWVTTEVSMDFREGGREVNNGGPPEGPISKFYSTYYDIIPNERIVNAYEMYQDDTRISVSLATMELTPEGDGTRLTFTEQDAFLDGYDDAGSREDGTRWLFEQLAAVVEG